MAINNCFKCKRSKFSSQKPQNGRMDAQTRPDRDATRGSLPMEELEVKGQTKTCPTDRDQRSRGSYTYTKQNRLYDKDYNRNYFFYCFNFLICIKLNVFKE